MASWQIKLGKLVEAFYSGIKYMGGEYKEIYINPTSTEINEVSESLRPKSEDNLVDSKIAGRYVRYTAIPSKKIFVFSPYILHEDLDRKFGIDTSKGEYIHGIARKIRGKWTTVEAHSMDHIVREHKINEIKKFINTDWSWMDKYILTTPFIRTYELKFRKIIDEA